MGQNQMTNFKFMREAVRTLGQRRRIALVALVAFAAAACNSDKFIAVDAPDVVTLPELQGKASLNSLLGGAISNFQVAFSGSSGLEGQVVYSGLLGDELRITDTFGTRIEIDARDIQDNNSNATAVFRALSQARGFAEQAARAYVDLASTQTTAADTTNFRNGRAESLALAGFTYVLFAENYCADGIPFSELAGDRIIEGAPIPRDSILARALQRFDTALALAKANGTGALAVNLQRLARIGRARVYLNRADSYASPFLDSAIAAIGGTAGVPTTYQYQVTHSENTGRENNGIYTFNWGQLRVTETDSEGTNGLFYKSGAVNGVDVRTSWSPGGSGFDRTPASRMALTNKYPERKAPVTLASGAEARMIEAEAALRKGDIPGFIAAHNAVRAANTTYNQCYPLAVQLGPCINPTAPLKTLTLLPPATAADSATMQQEPGQGGPTTPGSPSQIARENFQFKERAFYLYLTSHRLGDMRREVRQIGRSVNTVFPTGRFVRTAANRPSYGTDVAFPVPFDEQNNSKYIGKSCDNSIP